ncbi:MAG: hypothetical protein JSR77_16265 [Planctomycetes bacterium]|nr:hypothetical protein [Planctomycetota bacterium]
MNRVVAQTLGLAILCSRALAQATGAESLAPFWEAADTQRADIIMLGDSNQLYAYDGWEDGWHRQCAERFGIYATGLMSAGENVGLTAGVGSYCNVSALGANSTFQYSGAPALMSLEMSNDLAPMNYLYMPPGVSRWAAYNNGLIIRTSHAMGVDGPLRFIFTYGTFDQSGGTFRPCIRLDQYPYTILARGPDISTGGGLGLHEFSLDLPAGHRQGSIGMRFSEPGGPELRGPLFFSWMRCEGTHRPQGVAVHTLMGIGGGTAWEAAAALINTPLETLSAYLSRTTRLQTGDHHVLVRICFGVNDQEESRTSLGPAAVWPGTAPDAYADNLVAAMNRIEAAWIAAGEDPTSLYFLLTPSHPVQSPDSPRLVQYRQAAETLAASRPRCAAVRLDLLTTYAEMQSQGWYHTPTDVVHLSPTGYTALAIRELELLTPSPPCIADFDKSGGIDGADVEAFFSAFELGGSDADVNHNGGVEGSDVEAFFTAWQAGDC